MVFSSAIGFISLDASIQDYRDTQAAKKMAKKVALDAKKQVEKEGGDANKASDLRAKEEALKRAQEAAEAARKEAQAEAVKNQEAHKKALDELNKAKQTQKTLAKELKGKQEALSQDFFDTRKRIENLNKQIDLAEDQRDIDLVRELEMQRRKEEEKYERLVRDNKISTGEIKLIESGEKIENLKNQIAVAQENKQDDLVDELDARLSNEEEEFNQLISRHKISDEKVNLILSQNTVSAAEEKLGKAKAKIDIPEHAELVAKAAKDSKKQMQQEEQEKKQQQITVKKDTADKAQAADAEKRQQGVEALSAKKLSENSGIQQDRALFAQEYMQQERLNMSEAEKQAILSDKKKLEKFISAPDEALKEMRFAALDDAQKEFEAAQKAHKQAEKQRDAFFAKNQLSQADQQKYSALNGYMFNRDRYEDIMNGIAKKKDQLSVKEIQRLRAEAESFKEKFMKEEARNLVIGGKTAEQRYNEDEASRAKVKEADLSVVKEAKDKLTQAQKAIIGKEKISAAKIKVLNELSSARNTYQKTKDKAVQKIDKDAKKALLKMNVKLDDETFEKFKKEFANENIINSKKFGDELQRINDAIRSAGSEKEKNYLKIELSIMQNETELKIKQPIMIRDDLKKQYPNEEEFDKKYKEYTENYDNYKVFKNVYSKSREEYKKTSLFTDVKNATKQVQKLEEKLYSSDKEKVESKKLSTKQKAGIGAGVTLGLVAVGGIIAGVIEGAEDTTSNPDMTFEQSVEGSDQEIVRAEETSESVVEPTGQTVVGSQGYEFND